jgi:hypothetical protein
MATNTTRLGLIKPDFVDVVDISELNTNADDIDAAVGAAVVTSTTRPGAPWSGQIIHETDTDKTLVWDGVAWVETGVADLDDLGDVDITTATTGDTLVYDGSDWTNQPLATRRNLLYNGAMQVHQRGISSTGITTAGYYTADRWFMGNASMGTWTQTVAADGPAGSGFTKSLKVECTTADAAPAAGDIVLMDTRLEGQDLQGLKKGTAQAQEITVSFWVKSNVTGTYIFNLTDGDNNRMISAPYTVAASGTWEKKVLTFPGDTTGVLDNDNDASLIVRWWLGAGSDNTSGTLNTSWAAVVTANRGAGQVNLAAATSNYWQITGVQLEVGPVATPFEFKSFGQELLECQRYYYRINGATGGTVASAFAATTTVVWLFIPTQVTMRTAATALEQSGTASHYDIGRNGGATAVCTSVPVFGAALPTGFRVVYTTSGLTAGEGLIARVANTSGFLAWSAEL